MEPAAVAAVAAGATLLAVGAADVFLTIAHPDFEGPVARRVQRGLWRAVTALGPRTPWPRAVLALGGPVLLVATIVVWTGLLIVGFALVAWPFLDGGFLRNPAPSGPAFVDALYWSGTTATTLGYGDIVPVAGPLRFVAVVEAASGFALLTGTLTFLFTALRAVAERNVLALRVLDETGGDRDGVALACRIWKYEGVAGLRGRLREAAASVRELHEATHRYPLLIVAYRSRDPALDPEPMVRALAEAAIAARLLAGADEARALVPPSEELLSALDRYYVAVTRRAPRQLERFHAPPEAPDAEAVAQIRRRLAEATGLRLAEGEESILQERAARLRRFLVLLDEITRWRSVAASEQDLEAR